MYLITFNDRRTDATRRILIPRRDLASFAAQEIINLGHPLLDVRHTLDDVPLSVDQVMRTCALKAGWRRAYGRDIYAGEEAYYRRELGWTRCGP